MGSGLSSRITSQRHTQWNIPDSALYNDVEDLNNLVNKYQLVFSYGQTRSTPCDLQSKDCWMLWYFLLFCDTEVSICLPLVSLHQVNLGT